MVTSELSSISTLFESHQKMTVSNNTSNNIAASANSSERIMSGNKREAESTDNGESPAKRPYYGKCQYKTGKCFNERTLKRNGDTHSLCEEHRIKQNLIQRRSDRKYQTVHAIRRRERSQRRAVLKKQVSMAVAQQLFYEHQQQKTLGMPLPQHHPLHLLTANANGNVTSSPGASGMAGLAPPIQLPQSSSSFVDDLQGGIDSPLLLSFQPQREHCDVANETSNAYESNPTEINNFTEGAFMNIPVSLGGHNIPVIVDGNITESSCSYTPFAPFSSGANMWSEDDIEFLQTILLT